MTNALTVPPEHPVAAPTAARRQARDGASQPRWPSSGTAPGTPPSPHLLEAGPPARPKTFSIKKSRVATHAEVKAMTKPSWELRRDSQECDWNKEGLGLLSLMHLNSGGIQVFHQKLPLPAPPSAEQNLIIPDLEAASPPSSAFRLA